MNGIVIKISGINTAVIRVERSVMHPIYGKRTKVHSKIMAHDNIGVKVGDRVNLVEIAPISKKKRHQIKEKL